MKIKSSAGLFSRRAPERHLSISAMPILPHPACTQSGYAFGSKSGHQCHVATPADDVLRVLGSGSWRQKSAPAWCAPPKKFRAKRELHVLAWPSASDRDLASAVCIVDHEVTSCRMGWAHKTAKEHLQHLPLAYRWKRPSAHRLKRPSPFPTRRSVLSLESMQP